MDSRADLPFSALPPAALLFSVLPLSVLPLSVPPFSVLPLSDELLEDAAESLLLVSLLPLAAFVAVSLAFFADFVLGLLISLNTDLGALMDQPVRKPERGI